MADLKLTFAMTPYDRILPIISGEVKPDGITLEYMGMPGAFSRVFYEQIKFQRYDVSEMSISSFLRMRSIGWPYRLLPVFHNRSFSYTFIHIRLSSGIRQGHPEDLKGKRIGIGDYQQSLGLWSRGILQMEFGIRPEDMIWYQERGRHFSHTGASAEAGLPVPSEVTLHYAKTDLNTMYLNGELDASATLYLGMRRPHRSGVDRASVDISQNPDIVTLFPDLRQESIRFFKKTGVYPPHHTTAVRDSILEEHPWVAISLMEAFEESKRIAIERLRQNPPTLMVFGQLYLKELDEIFGPDPYPYGIKANAKAFDMAQTFSVQQGLTERKQPLEEIFPREIFYREERLPGDLSAGA
jgi:4,5-dihydroxyphthalate decarboxylase